MTKTLDLGCGTVPRNPFNADQLYGVDVRDNLDRTVRSADLAIEPIPFEDASFDYVTAYDFIEHMPRLVYAPTRRNAFVELMNEIYRVLKPGGIFLSSTPAYPHEVAFRDPTHVNIITEKTFPQYFDLHQKVASMYGFNGGFEVRLQEWRGEHLFTTLRKPLDTRVQSVSDTQTLLTVIVRVEREFSEPTLTSVIEEVRRIQGLHVVLAVEENKRDSLVAKFGALSQIAVVGCNASATSSDVVEQVLPTLPGRFGLLLPSLQAAKGCNWTKLMPVLHEQWDTISLDPITNSNKPRSMLTDAANTCKWAPVVWRTDLLKTMGVSQFSHPSSDAWFYDNLRLVVVAASRSTSLAGVLPDQSQAILDVSCPYSMQRVAHWLFEQNPADPAIPLFVNKARQLSLTSTEVDRTEIQRQYQKLCAEVHIMGDVVPLSLLGRWKRTMARRQEKWKRSYRKRMGLPLSPL